MSIDVKSILQRAKGNWFAILTWLGIAAHFLNNKNGPCPKCGGKDRFRWDNKNGDGGGYCHQCDFKGSGLVLAAKWLNLTSRQDFPKLLKIISDALSSMGISVNQSTPCANSANFAKDSYIRELAEKIWIESKPLNLDHDNAVLKYLKRRGLKKLTGLESLRFHPELTYFDEDGKSIGKFPALVSKIVDVAGNFLGIHRIYLDEFGNKANLNPVKMALGKIATGAIHLDAVTDVLNVAEGIETALAVRAMTGQPTWAAISAGNLKNLHIPDTVRKVTIWADLDRTLTGESAAKGLALMLEFDGVKVEVRLPDQKYLTETSKSFDWLDYYNLNHK